MEYQYHQPSDVKIAALETSQLCHHMYKGRFDQPDFKSHCQMLCLLLKSRNELLYQENYMQNYASTRHHPPPRTLLLYVIKILSDKVLFN